MERCRLDKWLWAVRIYKTRSLAADACKSGRVRGNGEPLKAAKLIAPGDVLEVRKKSVLYRYRVLQVLEKRVSAKVVDTYMEDITPEEELEKLRIIRELPASFHQAGRGRPTKKARRVIERFRDPD